MEIKIDTHTHTIASGHAYNTIREMASMAESKGLEGLAITEHAPKMPGTCGLYYFQNLKVVPRKLGNLRLLFGVELNILDENGTVDLPEETIRSLDIAVASIHPPCYGKTSGREENTRAYVNAMRKDYIDIIGHPDDGRYGPDYDILARTARETGTLLEINNSSLSPKSFRKNSLPPAGRLPGKHLWKRSGNAALLQEIRHNGDTWQRCPRGCGHREHRVLGKASR